MIPPTSIDGTDITGATIDSTDVQEITVDGDVVFSAAPPVLPSSLVARYTFDDADVSSTTVFDVVGSNDGTIKGSPTSASGANQTYTTNESRDFDSSNPDWIDIDLPVNTFSEISFACWVKTTDKFIMSIHHSGPNDIRLEDVGVAFDDGSFNSPTFTSISDNSWHHICITHDDVTLSAYVDGTLDDSVSDNYDFAGSAGDVSLMSRPTAGGSYTPNNVTAASDGKMDDARFYDKALSSQEVSDLYDFGTINP